MDTIADVKAALDPVLIPLGFSGGQGNPADPDGQVIWCVAFSQFAQAFPRHARCVPEFEPNGHECVDLIAELSSGHLVTLELEGVAVAETLRAIGEPEDAAEITALLGRRAADGAEAAAPVLRRLFQP